MTLQLDLCLAKYSPSRQAFVLESSPPMTTRPSSPSAVTLAKEAANSSGVSILCLPDPIHEISYGLKVLKGA